MVTVLVSWLYLELGIDACYFPGMDDNAKMWLQWAFPAYFILLVVLVIRFSSHSKNFSNFIGSCGNSGYTNFFYPMRRLLKSALSH